MSTTRIGATCAVVSVSLIMGAGCDSQSVQTFTPVFRGEVDGRAASYDWTGYSFARGDVDGDGQVDLLVAALSASEGGRVMVFRGPLTGFVPSGEADVTYVGDIGFANLGDSMLHAGGCDVDGDGDDDVLLGSPFSDGVVFGSTSTSGDNRGRAYVFASSPGDSGAHGPVDAWLTLIGEGDYDTFGSTVACLGDLDGDGFDDFAVAAKGSDRHAADAGAIYLFHGGPSLGGNRSADTADAVWVGVNPYEQAGYVVAPIGDVNGDGALDVAIGAPNASAGASFSGMVYVVLGQADRRSGQIVLSNAVARAGSVDDVRYGWSIDAIGDFDGDGYDDLVVGTSVLPGSVEAGRAYVVYGGLDFGATATVEGSTTLFGEHATDLAGTGVAGVGDLSGDGLADVMVGAPGHLEDGVEQGMVYMVPGRRDRPARIDLGDATWSELGPAVGAHFGENLMSVGDLDGDGRPTDFIVGAKSLDTLAVGAGAAMFYGAER